MENFHFKGFEPSDALRARAERTLDRIIERAPSDARITAAIEQDGELFHCSLEIGSTTWPLAVATSHKFASIALDKAELKLMRMLDKWSGTSFTFEESAPLRVPLRIAT